MFEAKPRIISQIHTLNFVLSIHIIRVFFTSSLIKKILIVSKGATSQERAEQEGSWKTQEGEEKEVEEGEET